MCVCVCVHVCVHVHVRTLLLCTRQGHVVREKKGGRWTRNLFETSRCIHGCGSKGRKGKQPTLIGLLPLPGLSQGLAKWRHGISRPPLPCTIGRQKAAPRRLMFRLGEGVQCDVESHLGLHRLQAGLFRAAFAEQCSRAYLAPLSPSAPSLPASTSTASPPVNRSRRFRFMRRKTASSFRG